MFQSVVRKDSVADLVAEYGHVLVDECHHVPAQSFERVLSEVRARHVTGLTATPKRRDGKHPIFEMQLGPPRYVVDPRSQSASQTFQHRLVTRRTDFDLSQTDTNYPIQTIYQLLAADEQRNNLILNDIIEAMEEGRSPIVLTERYVGEGFDDARLDTLFLTMPVSWRGILVQYAGRVHRSHPGKSEVRIYDYVDGRVSVLARMYERRLAGYRSIGYEPDAVAP